MIKNNHFAAYILRVFLIIALFGISASAWSAKLYVLENLRLRTEPSLESAILATVKKGAEVEVLGIDGDFTHIESPTGTKGWVASSFLTTEKQAVEPKSTTVKPSQLAQAKVTINKQKKEIKSLKKKLSENQKALKQLQKKSEPTESKQAEATPVAQPQISESEEKIAKIREILGPDPEKGEQKSTRIGFTDLSGIHYSIAAGLLLLGFILGLLWGDFIQRRRHGGYRV